MVCLLHFTGDISIHLDCIEPQELTCIWTVLTECIGLILRHWDTKSIGSLLQGLPILTVEIFKRDFSLLWLVVTSSGNIHPTDLESLNGTFFPRLVFKHSNVPSQSTFWQGKQIEFCKSSTLGDFLQPMNYSCLFFLHLIKFFNML